MALGPFRVNDRPVSAISIDIDRGASDAVLTSFTTVQVSLTLPNGTVDTTSLAGFISVSSVVITFPTTASVLTQAGIYILQATLVGDVTRETIPPVAFQVLALSTSAWASVGDVKELTNAQVEEASIIQAQAQVEITLGLMVADIYTSAASRNPEATVYVSTRDMHWLKLGVAYQAAWLESQPDIYVRQGMTGASQDGVSIQYTASGTHLSPLAKKALDRLSWMGSRSRTLTSGPQYSAAYLEGLDDLGAWERMPRV